MVLVAAAIVFVLEPQTIALQEKAFDAKEEGTRKAAYEAFFRMHTVVRSLYVLNLGLGIGLVVVKLKSLIKGSGVTC